MDCTTDRQAGSRAGLDACTSAPSAWQCQEERNLPRATTMAADGRPYHVCFALAWRAFRLPELRAAAEAAGVQLRIDEDEEARFEARDDSWLLPVRLAGDDSSHAAAQRLGARTVLAKSLVDVWASGSTWEELAASLQGYDQAAAAPYLAPGTTFCVRITTVGHKLSEAEKRAYIEKLGPLLPWKGKVRLKQPEHAFALLIDSAPPPPGAGGADGGDSGAPPSSRRYYFGRVVCEGQRELVGKYDLKRRNYIGTTSLDAELALLMADLAH